MKRYGLLIVLVMIISSFFDVRGISAYLVSSTNPENNTFLVKDTTTYTVVHRQMNLDGTTYTVVSQTNYEVPIGTTVSPAVNTYTGFVTPAVQTVTLNSFTNTVITYTYDRVLCHLTITDSQYVTTSTPTGDYYYGTEIHLIADAVNNLGNSFIGWTNNVANRDYTFVITEDTTIGPCYSISYQVTFQPNNGDSTTTTTVAQNQSVGSFPTVTNDDCDPGTGTYEQRNCTYYYAFTGWYLESNFIHQVNESYVPTSDVTLYAKWNKLYFHQDLEQFNNDHILDTGVSLFSQENAFKNFIVSFVVDSTGTMESRDVVFADMNETGDPYPGVNYRWFNNKFNINANVAIGNKKNNNVNYTVGNKVVIKRENGILYYSLDGGNNFTNYQDYSNFNLYFNHTATFGGNLDENGDPWRFFDGTLTDMTVEIIEPDTYTIHFDANGGGGMMIDQSAAVGQTVTLNLNTFTSPTDQFVNWNTQPDGTGTTYVNGDQVTDLANVGAVITLYAQWLPPDYYVQFDANGGTGNMDPQGFMFNVSQNLHSVAFTRSGYIFEKWNTQSDGSGTSYDDEALVSNLTNVQNATVTLYAIYEKIEYAQSGVISFNGTSDYIDTGVNLYTANTINKDFDLVFTVTEVDAFNATGSIQRTIMNSKDESSNKYPGFVVRFNRGESTPIRTAARWSNGNSNIADQVASNKVPITFRYRRREGIVYLSYFYEGYDSGWTTLYNQSSWQLTQYFPTNITFGAAYINGVADRFFKGSVRDIQIAVAE